jgi:hypothetical protein
VSEPDALTITDLFRGELARQGKFLVVQRSEMEAITAELEFQLSGCTDQSCAVELGRMLNAEKVIVGRAARFLGKLMIAVQVVDLARGDIEFVEAVDCAESFEALDGAVVDLAARMSRRVPLRVEVKVVDGNAYYLDAGRREGVGMGRRLRMLRTRVMRGKEGRPTVEVPEEVGELKVVFVDDRTSRAERVRGDVRVGDYARIADL